MEEIYLDTNILVTYFAKDEEGSQRKDEVLKAFKEFQESDNIKIYLSMWTVAELAQVLINSSVANGSTIYISCWADYNTLNITFEPWLDLEYK